MYLQNGSLGEDVKSIQEILKALGYNIGRVDGDFGDRTENAVEAFQTEYNLYADGIVGPNTWSKLKSAYQVHIDEQSQPNDDEESSSELLGWKRVPADKYKNGYDRFFLRSDVAEAYLRVRKKVLDAGGVLTSSGARRDLEAHVSASRSATSFHYSGRALDLFVGSGMENTRYNPYIITADGDRYWRVYVRAEGGEEMELNALTYGSRKRAKKVRGKFLDLTKLFKEEGFERIKARRSFFSGGTWLGAEWWHFQYEKGLVKGSSTFGGELLKVYTQNQLEHTKPWRYRNRIFGVNWG